MHKYANFSNNYTRELKCGSIDGGGDGEHNDVGFVEISATFTTQNDLSMKTLVAIQWYHMINSWHRIMFSPTSLAFDRL